MVDLDDRQIARIVDTSVMRLRSWAAVQQLAEAGAVWAQVWAVLDNQTSPICREMHGRVFRVADAAAEAGQGWPAQARSKKGERFAILGKTTLSPGRGGAGQDASGQHSRY